MSQVLTQPLPKAGKECCQDNGVFQRILVAIDDSEPAQWALKMGARIAMACQGAEMALVHVVPGAVALTPEFAMMHGKLAEDYRQGGQALLESVSNSICGFAPKLFLKTGEPAQQIIAAAKEWRADVVIVGTHGRGAVAHMLLGSTAESVVRHAHAPVLTVGCDPSARPNG